MWPDDEEEPESEVSQQQADRIRGSKPDIAKIEKEDLESAADELPKAEVQVSRGN